MYSTRWVKYDGLYRCWGSVTSAKMAAILDFTKNSNLPGNCENCKYFFLALYNLIELNILLLLVAFCMFFIQKWLDLMLLMTSYLVTIATDCRQTLPKCVSRITEQLLKTAYANNKYCWRNRRKTLWGWHPLPPPPPPPSHFDVWISR